MTPMTHLTDAQVSSSSSATRHATKTHDQYSEYF